MKKYFLLVFVLIVSCNKNNLLKAIDTEISVIKDFRDIKYIPDDNIKNGGIIETIESDGKTWTVRKLEQSLSFIGWREDIVDILDKPRGNTIYKVKSTRPNLTFVHTLAITREIDTVDGIEYNGKLLEDYWVKIIIDDDKIGWIFGKKLDVERGGPKYLTPENVEPFVIEDGSDEFIEYYIKENVMH
jgi:hypothetical protein